MGGLGPNQLQVSFGLAQGSFAGGGNTYTLTGAAGDPIRVTAHIEEAAGANLSTCELAIYGLPLSVMNQLTTFGTQYLAQGKNNLSVTAITGGVGGNSALVFSGILWSAYVDGRNQPQVCLRVSGRPGAYWNVKPQTPISINGSGDVATIAQKIAGMMEMSFENNGVSQKLANPYFSGSATDMMQKLAEHANIGYTLDKGTLAIVPVGGSRSGGTPLISPQTGMVGYPIFVSSSIVVQAEYNPNVKYLGNIQVQSDITPACGTWNVTKLEYDLDASIPHGRWLMTITGVSTNSKAPAQ